VILGVTVYPGIPMVSPEFFMGNPLSSKEKKYRKKESHKVEQKRVLPLWLFTLSQNFLY
jgi:hypothetical protein